MNDTPTRVLAKSQVRSAWEEACEKYPGATHVALFLNLEEGGSTPPVRTAPLREPEMERRGLTRRAVSREAQAPLLILPLGDSFEAALVRGDWAESWPDDITWVNDVDPRVTDGAIVAYEELEYILTGDHNLPEDHTHIALIHLESESAEGKNKAFFSLPVDSGIRREDVIAFFREREDRLIALLDRSRSLDEQLEQGEAFYAQHFGLSLVFVSQEPERQPYVPAPPTPLPDWAQVPQAEAADALDRIGWRLEEENGRTWHESVLSTGLEAAISVMDPETFERFRTALTPEIRGWLGSVESEGQGVSGS